MHKEKLCFCIMMKYTTYTFPRDMLTHRFFGALHGSVTGHAIMATGLMMRTFPYLEELE